MSRLYVNNAATVLNGSITSGQTNLTILNGSAFPATTGSDTFFLTLENVAGTAWEIVLVTAHAEGGTVLTVVRGQDGTTPAAWPDATLIERRVVAQEYSEFVSGTDSTVNMQGDFNIAGTLTVGTPMGVPSGGTGLASLTSKAILRGNGAASIDASLEAGLAGDVVATTDGTNWTSTPLTTMVTKAVVENALPTPLGVAFGGTGATTLSSGDILVGNGTGAITTIPVGSIGSLATTRFLRRVSVIPAGVNSFVPIAGAYACFVLAGGSGGGGGGAGGDSLNGGPGGAGGAGVGCTLWYGPFDPSPPTLTLTVGAAGTAGTAGTAGNAGGTGGAGGPTSVFYADPAINTIAGGGAGGAGGSVNVPGTAGATGAAGVATGAVIPPTDGEQVPPAQLFPASNTVGGDGGAGGSATVPDVSVATAGTAGTSGQAGSMTVYEYY